MGNQTAGLKYDFEVAEVFYQVARLLLISGGDEHRAGAYYRAALALDGYDQRVAEVCREGNLEALPGVGKSIASKIAQLFQSGRLDLLDELKTEVPEWLSSLAEARGVGPRALRALHKLQLSDPQILLDPDEGERLRRLAGIPAHQLEIIRQALTSTAQARVQLAHADALAEELRDWLTLGGALRVEKTGALRRREEAVELVELLICAPESGRVKRRLRKFRLTTRISTPKPEEMRLETKLGAGVSCVIVQLPELFERTWLLTTGNSDHLMALMQRAESSGVPKELFERDRLSFRPQPGSVPTTEEGLYGQLGVAWIPPELRQGTGEVDLAARGILPQLVCLKDVKADLHIHTRWSDGIGTVVQMAEAGKALGYEFLAVTDHSSSLRIANGLTSERLLRQLQEIEEWNRLHPEFRLLRGIEVDVLPDGSLDLPDHILARLDWVIASVHSAMTMPQHQMMRRLRRALTNPHVDALGHPTGRLLGKPGHIFYHRDPYAVDVQELLSLCAENGVGLEINCFPERMDLSADLARQAAKFGVPLHLATDSHAPQHLQLMRFGVDIARRAGLARESLRNCRSAELLLRQRAELAGGRRAVATGIKRSTSGLSLAFDEQPRTFDRFFGDSPEIALGDFSVVGIDLTAGASRASGWALLRGREAATRSLRSDDDLISATLDSGASLVSIDSPLSLPKGRCCAREDCPCRSHGILRESERTLMTMRVGVFPCLLPSMSALTLRGIRLAATLRERGVEVIESYPGAAQDVLGISRKSRGLELLVQGLTGFGIKLPTNHTLTHDELDAITSGLVGYFWHAGQYFGLGIPEENYLIVPRVPKFRENSQATVLGLAGPVAAGKTTVGQYLAFKYGFRYTRYSLVLRQFLSQPRQDLSRVEMQDFGQHVHETVGPVKLTQRVISQMTPAENWVVDGLRHVGDYETFLDELGLRFHMVFIEASEANRLRRIGHRNAGSAIRENHAVESEVPLLSFRTTLRVDNNRSFRHLFEQVDRILGVR